MSIHTFDHIDDADCLSYLKSSLESLGCFDDVNTTNPSASGMSYTHITCSINDQVVFAIGAGSSGGHGGYVETWGVNGSILSSAWIDQGAYATCWVYATENFVLIKYKKVTDGVYRTILVAKTSDNKPIIVQLFRNQSGSAPNLPSYISVPTSNIKLDDGRFYAYSALNGAFCTAVNLVYPSGDGLLVPMSDALLIIYWQSTMPQPGYDLIAEGTINGDRYVSDGAIVVKC